MQHILEPSADVLANWLVERGQPAYRARQVRGALFERRVGDFAEMTELPKDLRSQLAADFRSGPRRSPGIIRRPMARKNCCWTCTTASGSNACCCATGRGGRFASARKSAARWAACFAPAGWMAWPATSRPAKSSSRCCGSRSSAAARGTAEPYRRDGHGRAAGEFGSTAGRRWPRRLIRTAWASAIGGSRSRPSACRRRSIGWPSSMPGFNWPSRCMRRTTSCGIGWCR